MSRLGNEGRLVEVNVCSCCWKGHQTNKARLRGKSVSDTISSTAGDIDLDENVATTSCFANGRTQECHTVDSVVMLSDVNPVEKTTSPNLTSLKQSNEQNWESYMRDARSLLKSIPQRKEGNFVEAFVNGIGSADLKRNCETWLDQRHWIWIEVETFAKSYGLVMTSMDSQVHTTSRTESRSATTDMAGQEYDEREAQAEYHRACGEPVSEKPKVDTRTLVDESVSEASQLIYNSGGQTKDVRLKPRRSQRLAAQSQQTDASTLTGCHRPTKGKPKRTSDINRLVGEPQTNASSSSSLEVPKCNDQRNFPSEQKKRKINYDHFWPDLLTKPAEQITPEQGGTDSYTLPSPVRPPRILPVQAGTTAQKPNLRVEGKTHRRQRITNTVQQARAEDTEPSMPQLVSNRQHVDHEGANDLERMVLELLQSPPRLTRGTRIYDTGSLSPRKVRKAERSEAGDSIRGERDEKALYQTLVKHCPGYKGVGKLANGLNDKSQTPIPESQARKDEIGVVQRVTMRPKKKVRLLP